MAKKKEDLIMIIISQIKPNPEKVDASGTNVGPNSPSRAAKCPSPRDSLATLPSVEGPTRKSKSGLRMKLWYCLHDVQVQYPESSRLTTETMMQSLSAS